MTCMRAVRTSMSVARVYAARTSLTRAGSDRSQDGGQLRMASGAVVRPEPACHYLAAVSP
jgi:hypothetical protein